MTKDYSYLEGFTIKTTLYTNLNIKLVNAEKDIGLTIVAAHDRPKTEKLVGFKKDQELLCLHGPSSKKWNDFGHRYHEVYNELFDKIMTEIESTNILTIDSDEYVYGEDSTTDGDLDCVFN